MILYFPPIDRITTFSFTNFFKLRLHFEDAVLYVKPRCNPSLVGLIKSILSDKSLNPFQTSKSLALNLIVFIYLYRLKRRPCLSRFRDENINHMTLIKIDSPINQIQSLGGSTKNNILTMTQAAKNSKILVNVFILNPFP